MRSRLKAMLAAVAATLAGLAAVASQAFAGSFVVSACSPLASPGPWARIDTNPAGLTAGQACGGAAIGPLGIGEGGLFAEDNLSTSTQIANGAAAGWVFVAPSGTTITGIAYYRALSAYNDQDLVAGLFQASGAPLEQCMIPWPFLPGDSIVCSKPNMQASVTFTGLSTSSLFFGVLCRIVDNATACVDGGAPLHSAQADLYSASVTLSQATLPTLSQPGGPLFGTAPVWGSAPVTFAASDPSGIQHVLLRSDTGQTVASADQACNFTVAQPCPQLPAGSLSVDTTRVLDGAHTFSFQVIDAAGNTQTATSPSVVIDNNGPAAPTGLSASARGGSGAIDLKWANPAAPPVPVAGAMVQLCQTACAPPVNVSPGGAAQITALRPGTYAVRLWLLDAQGRGGPQNAARINVTVPTAGGLDTTAPGITTAPPNAVTAVIQGRRLRVSGAVAVTGEVNVSWRSRRAGRTLGHGSRAVIVRGHQIAATFTLSAPARTGTVRVVVRSGRHIIARASAAPCSGRLSCRRNTTRSRAAGHVPVAPACAPGDRAC